jgi:hypothetical protein
MQTVKTVSHIFLAADHRAKARCELDAELFDYLQRFQHMLFTADASAGTL